MVRPTTYATRSSRHLWTSALVWLLGLRSAQRVHEVLDPELLPKASIRLGHMPLFQVHVPALAEDGLCDPTRRRPAAIGSERRSKMNRIGLLGQLRLREATCILRRERCGPNQDRASASYLKATSSFLEAPTIGRPLLGGTGDQNTFQIQRSMLPRS